MILSNMFSGAFLLFSLGGPEIILVLVVFVLLFGAKKIPELARGLGKGIREFKDASQEIKREIDEASNIEDAKRLDS
ncbi:MAG: twin-arginine translocase TatA/TatE family subunit [Bacteroidia bacterium]|nr:twin-arginine translocase TatA/TatE family subunit [Bacteroidia bacterium]